MRMIPTPRILVWQPVVPKYRVPFFEDLEQLFPEHELVVNACLEMDDSPKTVVENRHPYNLNWKIPRFLGRALPFQIPTKKFVWPRKGDTVVVSGHTKLLGTVLYLLVRCKLKNIPIIWWGQSFTFGSTNKHRIAIRQWLMNRFDMIMLYTEYGMKRYISAGFDPNRLVALQNTIDINEIKKVMSQTSAKEIEVARKKYEIPEGDNLITVSRLVEKAHLDQLIRALPQIQKKSHTPVNLICVGSGPEEESLKQLAQELGIDRNVIFTGAIYEEKALAPLFMMSSLFVYPGAIGLSANHAFAYGLPIVTHSNRDYHGPEFSYIVPNVNGTTFTQDDESAMVTAITDSLEKNTLNRLREGVYTTTKDMTIENMQIRFQKAVKAANKHRQAYLSS